MTYSKFTKISKNDIQLVILSYNTRFMLYAWRNNNMHVICLNFPRTCMQRTSLKEEGRLMTTFYIHLF